MLTDMQVFNTQLKTAIVEKLTQRSDVFNAASGGAILLANASNMGDYKEESFWNNAASALRDIDAYAAQGAAGTTALSQDLLRTVKAMKGFGPLVWEPSQLTWIQSNPGEALSVISTSLSEAMLQAQCNRAIGVAVAGLANVANLTNDISATDPVTQAALNNTHALFGDKSPMLVSQVMTGATYHKLIGDALANSAQLFSSETVTVVDILGKRTVVTDSPALIAGGKNRVLCLTPGAVSIEPNNDFISNIETSNQQTRIETTYQSEWTENVGLKGFAWDEANGGASPVTAELETGTNWDQVYDDKNCAGTILIAQ